MPKKVGWSNVANVFKRKLNMLDAAKFLCDFKSPPKNRLEALSGSYKGFYSIRVNDQLRIVFKWSDSNGASEVDVVDYH